MQWRPLLAALAALFACAAAAQDYPVKPVKLVVPYAPGGLPDTGSIHHLATEALKAAFGLDIIHVPYKGTGQSVPALLGGQVSLLFSALPSIETHAKAGKVRLLANSTPKRSPLAPEVPTVIELGAPGFDFAPEIGLAAPAGTSSAIVARLAAEAHKAVFHADTVQRFGQLGIDPVGSQAAAYSAVIRAAYERYGRAVRASGARVD